MKKVIILTEEESTGLEYIGLANDKGRIVLRCDYYLPKLAHELAHTKEYNSSFTFQVMFSSLFDFNIITKGEGWRTTWEDGKRGPRKGYISPTAAKSIRENTAQYVETFYYNDNYEFWRNLDAKDFDYVKALEYLHNEGFITQEQFGEVSKIIQK